MERENGLVTPVDILEPRGQRKCGYPYPKLSGTWTASYDRVSQPPPLNESRLCGQYNLGREGDGGLGVAGSSLGLRGLG